MKNKGGINYGECIKSINYSRSILLAILIIALGVYIFNQARSATNMDDLSNQQVEAHNATFQNYEGTINGTQAKALIDAIRNNNQRMPTLGQITVDGVSGTGLKDNAKLATEKNTYQPTSQYEVSITEYQTQDGQYKGYVTKMKVTKKN